MASLARSSSSRADEIGVLRVEIGAANKKIRQYNDTIVSQANELVILRNIINICQSCKRKYLDATFDLSPSPTPLGNPLHGSANFSSSSLTPQAATSTFVTADPISIAQASTTSHLSFQPAWEVPDSQVSPRPSPTSRSPRQHAPSQMTGRTSGTTAEDLLPPNTIDGSDLAYRSNAMLHSGPALSRSSNQSSYSVISSPNFTRPLSTFPLPANPVLFHSTHQIPAFQSSSGLASLSLHSQAATSSSLKRSASHHAPPPGQLGKRKKTGAMSSAGTSARPGKLEHSLFQWSVTYGPMTDKMLDVTIERAFVHPDKQIFCVKFSLCGKYIAVGLSRIERRDGKSGIMIVVVYSTETGKQVCRLVEHTKQDRSVILAVCFSPNGNDVAVGHPDGHITLWQVARKRVRNIFRHHRGLVKSLDFSPNGKSIVSTTESRDTAVRISSVRDGSSKVLHEEHNLDLLWYQDAKFSPNGRYVAAANRDGFLRIWNSRTRHLVVKWHGHPDVASSLAFMPHGKGLVTVGGDHGSTAKYWHLGDDHSVSTMRNAMNLVEGKGDFVKSIAIAPDGRWLLYGSKDGPLVWNISNGTQQCSLHGHPWVCSIDISRVGNYLAIGDYAGKVSLWKYTSFP